MVLVRALTVFRSLIAHFAQIKRNQFNPLKGVYWLRARHHHLAGKC
jgi:hypothetical protein